MLGLSCGHRHGHRHGHRRVGRRDPSGAVVLCLHNGVGGSWIRGYVDMCWGRVGHECIVDQ